MNEEVQRLLGDLSRLLRSGGDSYSSNLIIESVAAGDSGIENLLSSNELWGGSGSIADQALLENASLRKNLEVLLVKLGKLQMHEKILNSRTEMWVSVFEK